VHGCDNSSSALILEQSRKPRSSLNCSTEMALSAVASCTKLACSSHSPTLYAGHLQALSKGGVSLHVWLFMKLSVGCGNGCNQPFNCMLDYGVMGWSSSLLLLRERFPDTTSLALF
jgi:hypothetical protein